MSDQTLSLIEAAMLLAADRDWNAVTLKAIALEAGLPLATVGAVWRSPHDVALAVIDAADAAMLAELDPQLELSSVKDRLFDLMMSRFIALGPWRRGLRALARAVPLDPELAYAISCRARQSLRLVLELAGLSSAGLGGAVRLSGLAAVELDVMRRFLADDSPDLAPTMAALDKALGRADEVARSLFAGRRSASSQQQA